MSSTRLYSRLSVAIFLACFATCQAYAQKPANTAKKEPLIFSHNANIVCAQFDEVDNLLMTGSANGIVKLWDPENGKLIRSFGNAQPLSKSFFADFSPDGKSVVAINGRGGKVWNTKFGDLILSLTGYGDTIVSIHFSNDSKWLITASRDGTAKLWDVKNGKRDQTLNHLLESLGKGKKNGVTEARFCNKNRSIVTGCGTCIQESESITLDSALTLEVGKVSGAYDSTALIWDMQTGKVIHVLKGYPFDVSPDGDRIVSGSVNTSGNNASVWDVVTGKLVLLLAGHTGKVTSCQFSRNGKWIFTASADDTTCRIWDGVTGKFICYLNAGPGNPGSTYQLSPDGKVISSFSQDTVRIWNVAEGRLIHSKYATQPPAFSNDSGHMLIMAGKKAEVFETSSGKPVMVEKKQSPNAKKKVLKVAN